MNRGERRRGPTDLDFGEVRQDVEFGDVNGSVVVQGLSEERREEEERRERKRGREAKSNNK
jgi:hypothetical protein